MGGLAYYTERGADIFCPSCGTQTTEEMRFCPKCGHGLNTAPAETKQRSDTLVISGYVCGVLALFLFPIGFGIAGFVIGMINLIEGRAAHGIAQIGIAVVLAVIGATP